MRGGGSSPSLLMVSGMLWTVCSLTHEFVSICSSTDVSEKLLKPETGAQGRQPVSPPGSLEPWDPPGVFFPATLAAGPQHTPERRPTASTCSQGGAAKGRGAWPGECGGNLCKVLTQGRLPPRPGHMAVVRGDPGQLPVGSPPTPSAALSAAPPSLPQVGEQASLLSRGQPL